MQSEVAPEIAGYVLLVDDDDALRRTLARKLSRAGHKVFEAASGARALELLESHPVDVVVCDIHMPDMDGMAVLDRVRERAPDTPFVLLTGAPDMQSAVKAVGSGAFEYLTKPADLPRLGESVARAIEKHRLVTSQRRVLESAVHPAARARDTPAIGAGETPVDIVMEGMLLGGRYRVGRRVGAGGMGTVYEGTREDLARMPVAIKVVHPKLMDRPDLLSRFRREAEVVAALAHPNIVKVLDFLAPPHGPAFLVMELLRGRTLAQAIVDDASLSEQRVAFIASQVLDALGAAHEAHVIHRDLKPENLFLTNMAGIADVVKLLDFGVAKLELVPEDQRLTQTGLVLGTPAYMAPEYARGEAATAAGDLYALGCVMYEALAGELPFAGNNYHALLYRIQNVDPRPIRSIRPDVSIALAGVLERAMAKDPQRRFPSANAMAQALAPWAPSSGRMLAPHPAELAVAPTVEALVHAPSSAKVEPDEP